MIVKQNRFKNLVELHKEWTEAGAKASRATTHRRVKEFGYSCRQRRLTWAKEKKNWTVAQWSKSSFQMRASFVFHLETKVLESGGRVEKLIAQVAWSPVLSFQSVMIWGAMSSAGVVGPMCFLKTNVTAPVYQDISKHFMLPSADQLFKDADFILQAGFSTCPHCQKHQKLIKLPQCWCAWLASKLTRPEPIENLWVLSRGKWETRDKKMQMSRRPLSKKSGLPYHLSSATNWSPPCHAELRQ